MASEAYGAKGSAYAVRPKDVWGVGPHLVACGDLEAGDGARLLAWARECTGLEPSLFYSDPPWSPAFITRFRRGAGALEGSAFTVGSLVSTISRLAGTTPLFFEMGTTYGLDDVERWLVRAKTLHSWPITYSGKPATLYGVHLPHSPAMSFEGMDDAATPGVAMLEYTEPGQVVVDLCLGLGCTSRSAHWQGRHCWGLELHPRRCSATLADLAKLTGQQPMNIGQLV